MSWREDEAARYRRQIEQMQHSLEMAEVGLLVTTKERLDHAGLESRDGALVAHYKDTIAALTAALAKLEARH
jgi:hypothetical protein